MKNGVRTASRSALALGASAAVVTLNFPELLDGDRVPFYRDLLFFFVPFKHFLAEHLRRGELPLWNPWVFMGTPFLGGLQTGVLYPPSLLLLLPFPLGFDVFLLAHYWIALAGAYALLRDRELSIAASSIGALVFTLGGYLVSMLNLTNQLQGAAWAPWVLLGWFRLSRGYSAPGLISFVLAVALQILAGSPETSLMTLAVLAAWTVEHAGPRRTRVPARLVWLGALLALSVGLTAFQVLPTLEYLGESVRAAGFSFDEATQSSLEPAALLQLLLPNTAPPHPAAAAASGAGATPPWIASLYFGLVPLCLAAVGLASGRERRLWGALIAAGTLLALGKNSPLFAALYSLAPGALGRFRYPEKFFFLVHLSAMVLAGEGARRLIDRRGGAERVGVIFAAVLLTVGAALWGLCWTAPQIPPRIVAALAGAAAAPSTVASLAEDLVLKSARLVAILGAFVVVVLLAKRSLLGPRTFAVAVALLVAGDLLSAQRSLNPTLGWSALRSRRPLANVDELRQTRQRLFHYNTIAAEGEAPVPGLDQWWRISRGSDSLESFIETVWPTLFMNAGMVEGVGTICGADGLDRDSDASLRRVLSIVPREISLKLLRLYGVRFLIGPVPLDSSAIEPVAPPEPSPFFAYRVREPLPLAYLADRLWTAPSVRDAFNRLIAADFRLGRDAVVGELPPDWTDAASDGMEAAGEVEILSHESDAVRLQAHSTHRTLLVLAESDFPGWQATVDGRPSPILRANALVRGVALEAGRHLVEFRYRPASLRRGAVISVASLAILAAIAGFAASRPGASRADAGRGGS